MKRVGQRVYLPVLGKKARWNGMPIRQSHPEHAGKCGTILSIKDFAPLIRLDDGSEISGTECWWVSLATHRRALASLRRNWCYQCGHKLTTRACGPSHAKLAAGRPRRKKAGRKP